MLKKILLFVVLLLAVLAVIIHFQPEEFQVSRSDIINAPASVVFEQVNDLTKWENWSPWAKLDPNAKTTFEGPKAGKGAVMRWDGNMDVGKGSMEIVESKPYELVQYQLDMIKPLKGSNVSEITLSEDSGKTAITWKMQSKKNFAAKAMGLVMDCEKMAGDMFEQGLANLKQISEKR